MKQTKFTWIAGTALGLALVIGGCEKKSEDISPPATTISCPASAAATSVRGTVRVPRVLRTPEQPGRLKDRSLTRQKLPRRDDASSGDEPRAVNI